MLNILSLGAGVQSSTVLLMSCRGVLPRLDAAIFSDTQWEPHAVYHWLETVLEPAAKQAGIPIYRVSKGNLRADALRSTKMRAGGVPPDYKGGRWASMPFYTKLPNQEHEGQIRRQCTKEYKIEPIQKLCRQIRDDKGGETIRLWYGISGGELRRMRYSKIRWIQNYYPLVFAFDWPYHRHHCLHWLKENGFSDPPRSACIGCPYRSNAEWRALQEVPTEWNDAVAFDAAIRRVGGLTSDTYLHRSCKPLPIVDLRSQEELGQQNWLNECDGMCGI